MEQYITPQRIANSILQDKFFEGDYVFVEGEKDLRLFKKFVVNDKNKVKVTFGKKKMRGVYDILLSQGFQNMVGIRDADFIRLDESFDSNYAHSIYLTDSHDSEGMIINSNSFSNFLLECANEDKINDFEKIHGNLKDKVYSLSYPIACLRLANKIHNLGLVFKPVRPEGNKIKFKKFICEKTFQYLGHEKMINTIVEYSTNRGTTISDRSKIVKCLDEVISLNLNRVELTNGHDISEILYIICKKGLRSTNNLIQDASSIEAMLRLSYSESDFNLTTLYKELNQWQISRSKKVFL